MNRLIVLFCAVLSVCSFANGGQQLRIDIFYESLCPDSVRFMTNQLAPNYYKIKNDVQIHFVPFGKANSYNGGESFSCQHGPKECEINKVQACALNNIYNELRSQDAQVAYVTCQMTGYADPTGEQCIRKVGASWPNLRDCTRTEYGKQLMLMNERATKQYSPRFIPTIVYNGVFNQRLQDASLRDFYGVVKSLL